MKKLSKPSLLILILVAITVLFFLTFVMAPASNIQNRGSSYNRDANGYGAWYAFMADRDTPVQRWEKPFDQLLEKQKENPDKITLIRVNSVLRERLYRTEDFLYPNEKNWVEQGNHLVMLGIKVPVTPAPFITEHITEPGTLKIATRRRQTSDKNSLVKDEYGAIIWQEKIGAGTVTWVVTPYLAANAYQNSAGNYEFLANLVTQFDQEIWIDEYIHGYQDLELIEAENQQGVISYFAKTPILLIVMQGGVLILLAIWGGNRPFGQWVPVPGKIVNNNTAYIQALAGVLQKANSREFIVDVLGKEQKSQLQKILGLGNSDVGDQQLIDAWVVQTGKSHQELEHLLKFPATQSYLTDKKLLIWLEQWQKVHEVTRGNI